MAIITWALIGVVNLLGGVAILATSHEAAPISIALTGIGGTTVIGVMAWIVKKVVSGEMVPLPIRTLIEKMDCIITEQKQIASHQEQEIQELRQLVRAGTEAQFAMHEHLRAVSRQDPPLPARQFSSRTPQSDKEG